MGLAAGRLRHFIRLEKRGGAQDPDGAPGRAWSTFEPDVPAEIVPLSAKAYTERGADQSNIVARCTIRELDGVTDQMRAVVEGGPISAGIYYIAEVLPDPTLVGHLTLMMSRRERAAAVP